MNFLGSVSDRVRVPEIEEKPTIENANLYISRLQGIYSDSSQQDHVNFKTCVRQVFQDYPIPS